MHNTKEPDHDGIQDEILAGPILRRMEPQRLVIWLATRNPVQLRLHLYAHGPDAVSHTLHGLGQGARIQAGTHCHIQLLDVGPAPALPTGQAIAYDLQWAAPGTARQPVFTTSNADNHLITLAEMLAVYLLVWSPVRW
ncbi:hypothetical protein [Castellaniella sp.]|uniref:hypothetical protein n=1 Tax=Castellaniella sp. TaxID=1955812 RepID=UPI002AFFA77B|nr:hypothetical protein [Castellaniella sp.]